MSDEPNESQLSDVFNAGTILSAGGRSIGGAAMFALIFNSVTGIEPSPKFLACMTGALTAAQLAAQLAWPKFWEPKA